MARTKEKPKRSGKDKKNKKKTLAEKADKFRCYQQSVQSPEHEIEFFEQAYRDAYRRKPYSLREDFCGTGVFSIEWAKSRKDRRAWGIDLDVPTLEWGREKRLEPAGEEAAALESK